MLNPNKSWEHNFLLCARDFLLCRLFLMGGFVVEKSKQYDKVGWQIGELDYQCEMKLIVREELARRHRPPAGPVACALATRDRSM